ncbi:hypothetical protein GCM10023196_093250 [Actinoallomurus vinaceus]|uniref:DUF3558 domain-containing protein n=1 Tax=Actinoallomurus vinaceus TaxID=1080074 RepID=A0ABP8URP2_9ACTN
MVIPALRLVAGFALLGAGLAGCSGSGSPDLPKPSPKTSQRGALPTCIDVVRHIPHTAFAVQDIKRYPTEQPSGASVPQPRFDLDCPTAFGHLSDGGNGTAEVLLTRMTVPSLDGTPRAKYLGNLIKSKLQNNICLVERMDVDVRGDPPVAASCYAAPFAGRAVVQGDLAIVVGVGGERSADRDAGQERRLLESAAQAVVDAVARMS